MHEHSAHEGHGWHAGHHGQGWRPAGPRHRWLEPFVLVLIADGTRHGYGLIGRLNQAGVAPGTLDVGELYRTLRELEVAGLVRSTWATPPGGARRREYELTEPGETRLGEWAEVMRERARLVGEFLQAFEELPRGMGPAASATEV